MLLSQTVNLEREYWDSIDRMRMLEKQLKFVSQERHDDLALELVEEKKRFGEIKKKLDMLTQNRPVA